jgi:hypothetical protein
MKPNEILFWILSIPLVASGCIKNNSSLEYNTISNAFSNGLPKVIWGVPIKRDSNRTYSGIVSKRNVEHYIVTCINASHGPQKYLKRDLEIHARNLFIGNIQKSFDKKYRIKDLKQIWQGQVKSNIGPYYCQKYKIK